MSVNYSSVLIYGMSIKNTKTTTVEKAFEHDFPPDVKFCSKTGKPLWLNIEYSSKSIDLIDQLRLTYYNVEKHSASTRDPKTNKKIPGPTTWAQTISSTPYYMIGVDVNNIYGEGEIREITPERLAEARTEAETKIKAYFDAVGITDQVEVKMYQMLYCG